MEPQSTGAFATFQIYFQKLVDVLAAVLFFDIGGFPFIVLWLVVAAVFFTVYLRGVNFRLFKHALDVAMGKYSDKTQAGEVSNLQALFSAIAATVGMGSLAGVAVAVATGGPGVIFWIVVMGLFGMATKFAEVTLSVCYRKIDENGKVYGGPLQYLKHGLADAGMPGFGKFLAVVFAIFCMGGALGGGNMFQSNQTVKIMTATFPSLVDYKWAISLAFTAFVFFVLIGSIKRVAKVAEKISPLKGILYLICSSVIIAVNYDKLGPTISLIFQEAFTGHAATGGFIAMVALSFKRALFANEAGLGSAPTAHAAARTKEPVQQGSIALLEPLFAAIIAVLTGLIVTITGAYVGEDPSAGVAITGLAFGSVAPWFPIMLAVNVCIFAYSTTIGWSYYGEIAWTYLFGKNKLGLKFYTLLFCTATFLGGVLDFGVVLDFSDLLILGMSLPNLIGVYILRKRIKSEMDSYIAKLKSGVIKAVR